MCVLEVFVCRRGGCVIHCQLTNQRRASAACSTGPLTDARDSQTMENQMLYQQAHDVLR